MGKNEILVTLETLSNHIYRPGDIVIGNVTTNLAPDVDLSAGITITLYGYAYVSWSEGTGDDEKSYSATDQLFSLPQVHNAAIHQTVYPFSFRIPDSRKSLPWTMKTSSGRVEYGVEALIKRPLFHFNKRGKATFILNSHIDSCTLSADNPHLSKILTSNSNKTKVGWCCFPFCCWYYCCAKENIKLTLSHQSILAMPGDDVPYQLDVDNSSTRRHLGNAKLQFVAIWKHIAGGSTTSCTEVLQEEIIQLDLSPREQVTKSGIFKLPKDAMPTQVECEVLKLTYALQVYMNEISGVRCIPMPATVETDILIGNA